MSADAQPNSKQRANEESDTKRHSQERTLIGTLCVVCGDRACSHLYYGVAACHGCKCFFWRTVKSRLTYTCRYDGKCSMSTAGRNACRYCRFMRCIESGMKLEAVRMDKKPDKAAKRKKIEAESDEYEEEANFNPVAKRQRLDNRLLTSSLLLIDRTATDGNGRQGAMEYTRSLVDAVKAPHLLDAHRTEMVFTAKVAADGVACDYGERRLFVWALDWTHQAADIEETLSSDDKIALLRACYAPLSLLQLGWHCSLGSDEILPLPNGSFLGRDAPLPDGCFLNNKLLHDLLRWSHRNLKPIQFSIKELVLLKALIVLNQDAEGLSAEGEKCVSDVRSRVQSALFQACCDARGVEAGAIRYSSMLLLLPQIHVMAVELCEHLRVRNTFSRGMDPLLFQLYGDIFAHCEDQLAHSASCSPASYVSDLA